MSTTRFWASAIAMDALVFAALISGLLGGSHFGLNAALFFCWVYTLLIWLVVFGLSQKPMLASVIGETRRRMSLRTSWKIYDLATDLVMPLLLAGFGYFILAGLLLFGQLFLKGRIYAWVNEQNAKDISNQATPEN